MSDEDGVTFTSRANRRHTRSIRPAIKTRSKKLVPATASRPVGRRPSAPNTRSIDTNVALAPCSSASRRFSRVAPWEWRRRAASCPSGWRRVRTAKIRNTPLLWAATALCPSSFVWDGRWNGRIGVVVGSTEVRRIGLEIASRHLPIDDVAVVVRKLSFEVQERLTSPGFINAAAKTTELEALTERPRAPIVQERIILFALSPEYPPGEPRMPWRRRLIAGC